MVLVACSLRKDAPCLGDEIIAGLQQETAAHLNRIGQDSIMFLNCKIANFTIENNCLQIVILHYKNN